MWGAKTSTPTPVVVEPKAAAQPKTPEGGRHFSTHTYGRDANEEHSALDDAIAKYDKDKDGKFSNLEVRAIVADVLKARTEARTFRMISMGLCAAIVIGAACVFGAAIAAIAVTKESFVHRGTGVQTGTDGQVVKTGVPLVTAKMHPASRRRLHEDNEFGGRQLVEVGDVPFDTYEKVRSTVAVTGDFSGSVEMNATSARRRLTDAATTLLLTGTVVQRMVFADGHIDYVVVSADGTENRIVRVAADNSSVIILDGNRRVMRRLEVDDAHEHRRLSELHAANSSHESPFECVVYHCFAGDEACDKPSDPAFCAKWADDGFTCELPLCMWIDESSRGRRLEGNCFPGDATVLTPDGPKAMRHVQVGDKVLSGAGGRFSDVYAIVHREEGTKSEYVRIETADGHAVEMSPTHFAVVGSEQRLLVAERVEVGMAVTTSDGRSAHGATTTVTRVSRVVRSGLYSPLTLDGTLVVGGVVAGVFSRNVPPRVGALVGDHALGWGLHALHLPGRLIYHLHPVATTRFHRSLPADASGAISPFKLFGSGGLLAMFAHGHACLSYSDAPSTLRFVTMYVLGCLTVGTFVAVDVALLAADALAHNVAGVARGVLATASF